MRQELCIFNIVLTGRCVFDIALFFLSVPDGLLRMILQRGRFGSGFSIFLL
jgi:hypothetical protein